jgi:hypothetical protein
LGAYIYQVFERFEIVLLLHPLEKKNIGSIIRRVFLFKINLGILTLFRFSWTDQVVKRKKKKKDFKMVDFICMVLKKKSTLVVPNLPHMQPLEQEKGRWRERTRGEKKKKEKA